MSILIGADLVPTRTNYDIFRLADIDKLVGAKLKEILTNADYRIFNLEVPLTDKNAPIDKCGPNLIAPENTINGIKSIGVNLFTLANNHIMDQGAQGLTSTLELLQKNEISYVGAGKNRSEASKPYIFMFKDKKIGVYACAEHEFSIAGENSCGANPFDALETPDNISELKRAVDYVIVLYHGGKEHYRYPSPNLQKVCRKLVDKGADLIVCQHSHCIGCMEEYNGGTIVYGQGNFLFDHSESEYWRTSLLVQIDEDFKITYIPIVKYEAFVRLAESDKADDIIEQFNVRSEEIKLDGFIDNKYSAFAQDKIAEYLAAVSAMNNVFVYRAVNKLTNHKFEKWIISRKYNRKTRLMLQNFVECEAHRELMLKGLNNG